MPVLHSIGPESSENFLGCERCSQPRHFRGQGGLRIHVRRVHRNIVKKKKNPKYTCNCLPDKNENIIGTSLDTAALSVEDTVPAIFKWTVSTMRESGLVKKLPTYNKFLIEKDEKRHK